MLKDNGRVKPAEQAELANLKGKHMRCPKCGEYAILSNVQFASTTCGNCGAQMEDAEMTNASKASGK